MQNFKVCVLYGCKKKKNLASIVQNKNTYYLGGGSSKIYCDAISRHIVILQFRLWELLKNAQIICQCFQFFVLAHEHKLN